MALNDDLNRLAAQDVVYLSRSLVNGPSEVFRGRLRQALNGNWVFNTSTGQNGVVGFDLGPSGGGAGAWGSDETPATGLRVSISYVAPPPPGIVGGPIFTENISLTTLIPQDFAD
jgi:hypothetical protein